ncbi:MAG: AfsR/SARP family transcriptional regulator [Ilumatobacteraceae bacterium]
MRVAQHGRWQRSLHGGLFLLAVISGALFVLLWRASTERALQGWLWRAMNGDGAITYDDWARIVVELCLLGVSVGASSSLLFRIVGHKVRASARASTGPVRPAVRCEELDISTRVDLVARSIATFPCERVFERLAIVSDPTTGVGVEWNESPVIALPDGWSAVSPTTWSLVEACEFKEGGFPYPLLISLGTDVGDREYFVDLSGVGGICFVGSGSSRAREQLTGGGSTALWSGHQQVELEGRLNELVSEGSELSCAGLVIDVAIVDDEMTWSVRGRSWQLQHRLELWGRHPVEETTETLTTTSDETQLARVRRDSADYVPAYTYMVRVLGEVAVENADGDTVTFERGRSQELLAWMMTHDERPTRSRAKSAMWEMTVRATTFANVISDIRRTLNQFDNDDSVNDWIQRDVGDDLIVDERVVSDASLLRNALECADGQAPADIISCLRWPVSLLRGLPFQGSVYRWPDPEGLTSELVILATTAAAELSRAYLEIADLSGVMWATGQGLRVLPGDEELIALRMKARAAQGDVAALRQEWDSYERVLADDWSSGTPSPMLRNLRRELLDDRAV